MDHHSHTAANSPICQFVNIRHGKIRLLMHVTMVGVVHPSKGCNCISTYSLRFCGQLHPGTWKRSLGEGDEK